MVVGFASSTRASATAAKVMVLLTGVLVAVFVGSGVLVGVGDGPGVNVEVAVNVVVGVKVWDGVGVGPEDGAVISYILPSMRLGSLLLSTPRATM